MKKLLSMVLALTLVASLGVVSASAADGNGCGKGNGAFVDANGDGLCDNVGSGCGNGYYFVDADGDGICDNYGSFIGRTTCGGNRCQR